MRRALLELLRKPVNTGVAIGLLFGLAYLEFSASAQPTQAPELQMQVNAQRAVMTSSS